MVVDTEFGKVTVKTEVIREIVYKAVIESYGAVEIGKQGFFDKLANFWTKEENKGVNVDEQDGKIIIEIYLVVEYGLPVKKVAENTQENVYHRINSMLNYENIVVNVHISGLKL